MTFVVQALFAVFGLAVVLYTVPMARRRRLSPQRLRADAASRFRDPRCVYFPFVLYPLDPSEIIAIAEGLGYQYAGSRRHKWMPLMAFTRPPAPPRPPGSPPVA